MHKCLKLMTKLIPCSKKWPPEAPRSLLNSVIFLGPGLPQQAKQLVLSTTVNKPSLCDDYKIVKIEALISDNPP